MDASSPSIPACFFLSHNHCATYAGISSLTFYPPGGLIPLSPEPSDNLYELHLRSGDSSPPLCGLFIHPEFSHSPLFPLRDSRHANPL